MRVNGPDLRRLVEEGLRLQWLEDQHTLHKSVEILYVVDGYEVQHTYDGDPVGPAFHGETLSAAIDTARAKEA